VRQRQLASVLMSCPDDEQFMDWNRSEGEGRCRAVYASGAPITMPLNLSHGSVKFSLGVPPPISRAMSRYLG
jgi:hypothetical protein